MAMCVVHQTIGSTHGIGFCMCAWERVAAKAPAVSATFGDLFNEAVLMHASCRSELLDGPSRILSCVYIRRMLLSGLTSCGCCLPAFAPRVAKGSAAKKKKQNHSRITPVPMECASVLQGVGMEGHQSSHSGSSTPVSTVTLPAAVAALQGTSPACCWASAHYLFRIVQSSRLLPAGPLPWTELGKNCARNVLGGVFFPPAHISGMPCHADHHPCPDIYPVHDTSYHSKCSHSLFGRLCHSSVEPHRPADVM